MLPTTSPGCAAAPPLPSNLTPGGTVDLDLGWAPASGLRTSYRLSVPLGYDGSLAFPLLVGFHGWGGSGAASFADFHEHSVAHGYIFASPDGFGDGGYRSWNGAGTTGSPGPEGPLCHDPTGSFDYCYDSCAALPGGCADSCWWTTCEDSVAQAVALLDELEQLLCVHPRRVYATGISNGGVFVHELAFDARGASRFAAFMPIIGNTHRGFNRGPTVAPAPFLGIWGTLDNVMPPFAAEAPPDDGGSSDVATLAYDTHWSGWLFSTARNTTRLWAAANGCDGAEPAPLAEPWAWWYPEQLAAAGDVYGASCVAWSRCAAGVQVVECLHPRGHDSPAWAPTALWSFMLHVSGAEGRPPAGGGGGGGGRGGGRGVPLAAYLVPALLAIVAAAGCLWWGCRKRRRQRKRLRKGAKLQEEPAATTSSATAPPATTGEVDLSVQVVAPTPKPT